MINEHPTSNPLHVTLPDECKIASTNTCLLDLPHLPVTAQLAHIGSDLAHSSLISLKQFCNAGCRVEYDITNCHVYLNYKITLDQEIKRQNY